MGHIEDRCDILDILEEAVVTKRAVTLNLLGGRQFTDFVTDVVTEAGQDYAFFKDHGRWGLNDIRAVARAEPRDPSYRGKPIRQRQTAEIGEQAAPVEVRGETQAEAIPPSSQRR